MCSVTPAVAIEGQLVTVDGIEQCAITTTQSDVDLLEAAIAHERAVLEKGYEEIQSRFTAEERAFVDSLLERMKDAGATEGNVFAPITDVERRKLSVIDDRLGLEDSLLWWMTYKLVFERDKNPFIGEKFNANFDESALPKVVHKDAINDFSETFEAMKGFVRATNHVEQLGDEANIGSANEGGLAAFDAAMDTWMLGSQLLLESAFFQCRKQQGNAAGVVAFSEAAYALPKMTVSDAKERVHAEEKELAEAKEAEAKAKLAAGQPGAGLDEQAIYESAVSTRENAERALSHAIALRDEAEAALKEYEKTVAAARAKFMAGETEAPATTAKPSAPATTTAPAPSTSAKPTDVAPKPDDKPVDPKDGGSSTGGIIAAVIGLLVLIGGAAAVMLPQLGIQIPGMF